MTARAYDERALLAAIYGSPDDDAARAVYADFLQARGDPRGAFIALQLAAAAGEHSAQAVVEAERLLRKHRRAWLAPFEGAVATKTAVFERGFLSSCRIRLERNPDLKRLFSPAAWATVKRIDFASSGRLTSAMKAIEEAHWVPDVGLAALAGTAFPRLKVLSVADGGLWRRRDPIVNGEPHSKGMRALRDAKGLPALRDLAINFASKRGPLDYAWLLESGVGLELETFGVNERHDDDDALIDAIRAWVRALEERSARSRLRRVVLTTVLGRLELRTSLGAIRAEIQLDGPRSGGWASVDYRVLDRAFDRCVADGLGVDWLGEIAT